MPSAGSSKRTGSRLLLAPVAGREDVHAHDLELRREHGARIRRSLVARDRCRQNFALFEQGRHEPVARAAVLDALADSEDVGIGRLHIVVDDDAAIDVEAGLVAELDIRPDARRDHDQVGFENLAVLELPRPLPLIPRIAVVDRPRSTRMPRSSILPVR